LSTRPKTPDGRTRIAEAQRAPMGRLAGAESRSEAQQDWQRPVLRTWSPVEGCGTGRTQEQGYSHPRRQSRSAHPSIRAATG